jgi:DNA-binding PadR family transcriptional regulator
MGRKSAARLAYYEGLRNALLEHFEITEQGLRKLKDVKPSQIEKLVADIQKQHRKLLNRIDRQIHDEQAAEKVAARGKGE